MFFVTLENSGLECENLVLYFSLKVIRLALEIDGTFLISKIYVCAYVCV